MFWAIVGGFVSFYLLVDRLIRVIKVKNYSSKHVLVTGCDRGFGRDLVIRLDKMGFPVFAACLTEDGRRALSEICSGNVTTLILNVTNKESIREALAVVKQNLPTETSLWAVVNNAGVLSRTGPSEMCFHEDYVFACSVNLFGVIEVSRTFLPLLRRSQGRLVLITSIAGRIACASAPYCVSKYGLEAFGDVIRREVSRFGVSVSMIEPGFFRTEIINEEIVMSAIEEGYKMADEEVQTTYGKGYLSWTRDLIRNSTKFSSPDTYKVIDAYVEAMTSVYPRKRYLVGNDARFFWHRFRSCQNGSMTAFTEVSLGCHLINLEQKFLKWAT